MEEDTSHVHSSMSSVCRHWCERTRSSASAESVAQTKRKEVQETSSLEQFVPGMRVLVFKGVAHHAGKLVAEESRDWLSDCERQNLCRSGTSQGAHVLGDRGLLPARRTTQLASTMEVMSLMRLDL
eukprot:2511740-Rhodomonas_salina.1